MSARWAKCATRIAGSLVVLLLWTGDHAQGPPPPVSVAAPIAKRITQWDEYSGRFEAAETVEVRPRVSGFIETVHFKDGQLVKAGDLLFTLEQRSFRCVRRRTRSMQFGLTI